MKPMKIVFLNESSVGSHLPLPFDNPDNFEIKLISTTAMPIAAYDGKTFPMTNYEKFPIIKTIKDFKPDLIIYGFDMDAQGNRLASVYKSNLEEYPAMRLAFCEKGYVAIAGFYTKEQFDAFAKYSYFENLFTNRLRKDKNKFFLSGIKRLHAFSALHQAGLAGDDVYNENPLGHSTATVITKVLLREKNR